MSCNIESKQTFTIGVDLPELGTLERALSFYVERAILPDGDPARDLSRQFTSMLLRLGRLNTDKASGTPGAPLLPPPSAETPDVAEALPEPTAATEGAQGEAETVPAEPNPLDAELESLMGDRPGEL